MSADNRMVSRAIEYAGELAYAEVTLLADGSFRLELVSHTGRGGSLTTTRAGVECLQRALARLVPL